MFATRLIELLKEKKISQKKISSDLNFGINQIRYWEKQRNIPNALLVQRIAEYLDVSVDYLLGKTEDRNKEFDENEQYIIKQYRETTTEGRIRIIQSVQNICDEIRKSK